jgi:hypothetical protein
MRQVTQSSKFMQAVIVLLIAGGVIFWVGVEMGRPAGRKDLYVEVSDLRSYVSESIKIIDAAAAGRLTTNFFRIETELLRKKLVKVTEDLASSKPEPGFEAKFAQSRSLAENAVAELNKLSPSFGDRAAMAEIRERLKDIYEKTVALEEGLKQ